jgi:hypothetical protein
MYKVRFLFGAALVATMGLAFAAAQAQPAQDDPAGAGMPMPMMGMGMGMMGGPMNQSVMTPFLLPELQSELGLSAQQVTQLRQLKQEMLTKGKDFSTQIAAKRKELDALLAPGTSKGEQVKKLFEQIANLRAQQLYTGYETTTKMKAALTDAQRTKLAAMKPYDFHQAMMSHMTMNDMGQMMQFMGGGGMMMGGMMMGQGMMGMPGRGMMMHEGMPGAPPKQ